MLFHFKFENLENNLLKIENEDYHHIINVLRKKVGESIKFTDGKKIFYTEIIEIKKNYFIAKIIHQTEWNYKKDFKLVLLIGLIKPDNFENILRWTVPLGVDIFVPVLTENSQKFKLSENRKKRWEKIIKEASIQSENPQIPEIYNLTPFNKTFELFTDYFKIIFHPYAEKKLKEVLLNNTNKKFAIYIGSEAGFTEKEIKLAIENNIKIAKISNYILRTELAALLGVSNILFYYE